MCDRVNAFAPQGRRPYLLRSQAECVKIMWECEFPKHYRGIAEGSIGRVEIL